MGRFAVIGAKSGRHEPSNDQRLSCNTDDGWYRRRIDSERGLREL